jgi:hypothetical protein
MGHFKADDVSASSVLWFLLCFHSDGYVGQIFLLIIATFAIDDNMGIHDLVSRIDTFTDQF